MELDVEAEGEANNDEDKSEHHFQHIAENSVEHESVVSPSWKSSNQQHQFCPGHEKDYRSQVRQKWLTQNNGIFSMKNNIH